MLSGYLIGMAPQEVRQRVDWDEMEWIWKDRRNAIEKMIECRDMEMEMMVVWIKKRL
ncbi:hypothetical protein DsansV1_C20g0164531 [Dioscorea sansibarensis]